MAGAIRKYRQRRNNFVHFARRELFKNPKYHQPLHKNIDRNHKFGSDISTNHRFGGIWDVLGPSGPEIAQNLPGKNKRPTGEFAR